MTDLPALYAQRIAQGRITPDPAQLAVLPALERVRSELAQPQRRGLFRKPAPVRGLYLWGGVGRGKSMLMDLLAETQPAPLWRRHFHAFMQWVHDEMARARKRGVDDALAPVADLIIADARLLCFDEVQITDITDAMLVGRLFERLFAGGVTVVATSNRPPDDLYKDGLNRSLFLPFIALIEERMEVIELASPTDHRQGRLAGEQRYFSPVTPAVRRALDTIWQRLTEGQAHPLVLRVKGHDLHIPGFHNGAARASFYDLCGQPLGPADYLALAGVAKVLVLEDIPQLGSENFNQARRFVTLIDTLYEARTKLIASAAARPDMLYVEGEGSFEFARTVSRLIEMQAQDWGRP
jgi:cell division protein ZapE